MEARWVLLCTVWIGLLELISASSWIEETPWRRYPRQSSCKCSCGVTRREQRIVGGRPTIVFAFPWMAGLLYKGNLYCGGALINDRYVLTAAHCVEGVDPRQLQVLLGGHDLTKEEETEAIIRTLSGLVKHPQFVRKTFNNDIALLRLSERVQFTRSVSPACLPVAERSYVGENATVIGWGRLSEGGPISPVLQQVTVPIYSDAACQSSRYGQRAITENMMCAGYDNGKLDACQGDSGGPLHYDASDKKVDVIGLVSWGQGCGRAGYPGVYTRVGRYLSWIEDHTRDACYCSRREGRSRTSFDIWNG